MLAAVGAVEAVVYLWRYRSASGSNAYSSALSAGSVQLLRVTGIGGIASAVGSGEWIWPATAYIVSPVIVTVLAHKWLKGRNGAP
tara:strand:+ start:9372 stop:9626 length:255 start_codon:yes stop_codon:yes gene_type:complete